MIIVGVILILVGYLLLPKLTGVPLNVETICVWGGWILLIVGIVCSCWGSLAIAGSAADATGTDGDRPAKWTCLGIGVALN